MFKNRNNFQISEEGSKKIDQEINSHQGILFLIPSNCDNFLVYGFSCF